MTGIRHLHRADYSRTVREVTSRRPEGAEVLLRISAHVSARPTPVFDALVDALNPGAGASSRFLADTDRSLVVAEGGYWYRAEYRVVPDERGSHIDHTILNIAPRMRGLSHRLSRKVLDAAPDDFDRLMRRIRLDAE